MVKEKKESNSIKNEGDYYLKVLFTALIVVLLMSLTVTVGYIGFQYVISKTRTEVNNYVNNPPFSCEFNYKGLNYKGVCSDNMLDKAQEFIEFDMRLQAFQLCISSPYSYRYSLCKEMEAR